MTVALVALAPFGHASASPPTGADVTVHEIAGTRHWGVEGTTHAYSVGTTACNQGTVPLSWCDDVNEGCLPGAGVTDHPVIGQNLYRLKDGRFEQIGMSWLKHGFRAVAIDAPDCGSQTCDQPLTDTDYLGVGCTDAYSAAFNGQQPLGRRSSANATTGDHPERPDSGGTGIAERLQVEEADIDPDLNPGARYWIEGHYLAQDDARDGNGFNNTSFREALFDPVGLELILIGNTVRQQPAIAAWQAADPEVELVTVDLLNHDPAERFHAARRVTGSEGSWHYEYVIHNLNSDRSARQFQIRFPGPADITNAGFRDIDHHSGEIYDTEDWSVTVDSVAGTVEWATDPYTFDANANALRWGTMFSFWFDADQPLEGLMHQLELFKPGVPPEVDQVMILFPDSTFIFIDGFESGDLFSWSGGMN